jgi:two-component system response regulator AtoC
MILSKDEIIRLENFPLNIQGFPEPVNETDLGETGLEERIKQFSIKHEKIIILKALEKCNNNRTNTAILLKISRKTLFNKMKKYGISR